MKISSNFFIFLIFIIIVLAALLLSDFVQVYLRSSNISNSNYTSPYNDTNTPNTTVTPQFGTTTINLSHLEYSQLVALNLPFECAVILGGSSNQTSWLYIKGNDALRIETPVAPEDLSGAVCNKSVIVVKGNYSYTDLSCIFVNGITTKCNWLEINHSLSSQNSTGMSLLSNLPASSFSCKSWAYNQSKFDIPGKICSQKQYQADLLNNMNLSS